jgi:hypothetical protein
MLSLNVNLLQIIIMNAVGPCLTHSLSDDPVLSIVLAAQEVK